MSHTALYTTVYPGAEKYISSWYGSVVKQSNRDFKLVIALDSFTPERFFKYAGKEVDAEFIVSPSGQSPAKVRETAFEHIVSHYRNVIFTDIDDILMERRIEIALKELETVGINACSMEIIDENTHSTGCFFPVGSIEQACDNMLQANVFGLTNTAYRCEILKELLPFPAECVMLDWFMVTSAWVKGVEMSITNENLMRYRQYEGNTARTLPPFTQEQVLEACCLLRGHYDLLSRKIVGLKNNEKMVSCLDRFNEFYGSMKCSYNLVSYVCSLNELNKEYCWWEWVALPELEEIWKN